MIDGHLELGLLNHLWVLTNRWSLGTRGYNRFNGYLWSWGIERYWDFDRLMVIWRQGLLLIDGHLELGLLKGFGALTDRWSLKVGGSD